MRLSPLALLQHYQPTDLREKDFLARMLALAAAPESWQRSHYVPGHFTASSFVFSPDYTQVALIWHPRFGRWLQPGGHIEAEDRDLWAAARREVTEELGISALEPLQEGLWDIDIHDIPARKTEPAHQHFDLRFAFVAPPGPLNGELQAQWVSLARAGELESDESVQRGLAKVRR